MAPAIRPARSWSLPSEGEIELTDSLVNVSGSAP